MLEANQVVWIRVHAQNAIEALWRASTTTGLRLRAGRDVVPRDARCHHNCSRFNSAIGR